MVGAFSSAVVTAVCFTLFVPQDRTTESGRWEIRFVKAEKYRDKYVYPLPLFGSNKWVKLIPASTTGPDGTQIVWFDQIPIPVRVGHSRG